MSAVEVRARVAARGLDADLAVAPGTVVALVGPNGAGKSSILQLVGGQLRPDAGTVTIDGNEGVELGVEGIDAIEEQGREFDAGNLPRIERAAQFREGSVDHGFGSKVGFAARPFVKFSSIFSAFQSE